MGAREIGTQAAPVRGVVGRAGSTSVFDLDRWAPSDATARFVENFWSVSWDHRERGRFDSTVITFPSIPQRLVSTNSSATKGPNSTPRMCH
jgi:hypothetical protein